LVVSVSPGGERSFLTDRGVADSLSASMLRPGWLSRVDALHVPFYSFMAEPLSSAALAAIASVRGRSVGSRSVSSRSVSSRSVSARPVVSIDLASRGPLVALGRRRVLEFLRAAAPDVLLANDDELTAIGSPSPGALAKLAPISVIKQGSSGCRVVWRTSDGSVGQSMVATRRVVASDTTGAGDAFDAGFLHALLLGGYLPAMKVDAALLRRAALSGHRSAARLLTSPRKELPL